jgi:hypothetical protein
MATFQRFEEIEAWQKARELTRKIYRITKQGAFARDFGLKDQIRDASVSMMSNIAEGFERSGTGELLSSYRSPKARRVKCDLSCTSPGINSTSTQMFFRRSVLKLSRSAE